ncbi:MAG TPA: diguanylate cyclase [Polyangiaceae bacterium LLY-WYZ-15_(1-7)]|nr:diguanylate cyclase [Sandaracinus sp.]HJL06556.1 diguanylate cyclase [Polyangiaceae bacterium LLY-WYZ-15_(1-7)]HJL13770.1 diguanylate cyclase [Polyangiaceae bacterium LLY-WYZ-15_(1-7)]HJL25161.1 diguanylate cyclase [Polyangiaceae bacterium LLY-WYZ-15_(1-7)]HJL28461.1 diguanylate cyclase [Polyangiaceae bacterium LLY-WYZ-15_(1-7)]
MTTLVHAALTFRRTVRGSYGFLAAAAFLVCLLLGVFEGPLERLRLEHAVVGVAWLAIFGARFAARWKKEEAEGPAWIDLELGLLILVAVHAAIQIGGGLASHGYAAHYVVVAFLASFARRPMGHVLVLCAVGLEVGVHLLAEDRADDWLPLALHAAFTLCFGLMSLLFTRVEIARVREVSRRELEDEKEKVKTESRMFRLVSAPSAAGASDEERLVRSSVEELHHQVYHVLTLLQRTLGLHTCVLLMRDDDGDGLRIVELVTESDHIAEGPFGAGEGAVGAVVKRQMPMNLRNLKPGYKGLCYYEGPALVRAFLGVPILDGGQVRGVLCADRIDDRPFTESEELALQEALAQVLRALENERVFVQLERTKREQTILYRASQALGAALDEGAVIEAGLEAAGDIAPHDFAAISFYDPDDRRHRVKRAIGDGGETFEGLTFRDNTSLTAMAVKNRHYLPYRGDFDARQQTVFTKRANLRGMKSLLILPLVVREDAIGTMILAARRAGAFGPAIRPTLQLLANQLAVSLSNAQAVKRLEEMATTDGLTGCLNKRAFLEELDRKLRSATRFGRQLSLIVTDIDHFKSVNDTYGHATGDVVIKELGALLRRVKRETDIVARFGGEEFCVLCEETDTEGARLLAERVREELGGTTFQTELGELRVTASLGVATYPEHADDGGGLFEASDKALYAAKHGGRNQVCVPE